ncbi:MAG: hypothetical protein ABFS02_03015 [Pseudomonadota bacterium]
MFGSMILETAIGLILIYLMLGLVCTAFNELISQILKMRANTLAEGIRNVLADPGSIGLAKEFYDHPLIKAFYRSKRKPSYIPPHTFAMTLTDIVTTKAGAKDLKTAIDQLENREVKTVLRILLKTADGNLEKWQQEIETWFNDAMDRVAGWYKRKTQVMTLLVALFVVVLTNADTIMLANSLARDTVLRSALVAQAEGMAKLPSPATQVPLPSAIPETSGEHGNVERASTASAFRNLEQNLGALRSLGLPIGWSGEKADQTKPSNPRDFPANPLAFFNKLLGLLVTTLAVSLGAPFWFDLLNKFVNIRAVGKTPASKRGAGEKTGQNITR